VNNRSAVLVGLVALVVAVLAIGGAFFGPNSNKIAPPPVDVASGDPGISARTTTTEPFQLAAPGSGSGLTTIPGAPPTFYNLPSTTTSTEPPTSTTTSTTLPLRPSLPRPGSITSVCGLIERMSTIDSIFRHRELDAIRYIDLLVQVLDKYVSISPPSIAADVVGLRDMAKTMAEAIHAAGGDVMASNVRGLITAVASASPPYDRYGGQIDRVSAYERQACPGQGD
jgi:hypothetical protein